MTHEEFRVFAKDTANSDEEVLSKFLDLKVSSAEGIEETMNHLLEHRKTLVMILDHLVST